MTKAMIFSALPLAAALLLGGCASTSGGSAEGAGLASDRTIVVENHGWETVRVYAVRNNARMRLGTVRAMATERFDLKPGMVTPQGHLQLMLKPIAGPAHLTEPVSVGRGGAIHLNVQDVVHMSSFAVFSHERGPER